MSVTPNSHYESGRKGAAGEMVVIADLLHRGYEVWRAVSGQAACDLVTEIDGKLYKVEVRSVARQIDGTPNSPGGRTMLSRKGHHILAVVDRATGSVRYFAGDGNVHVDLIDHLPFPKLTPAQEAARLLKILRDLEQIHLPTIRAQIPNWTPAEKQYGRERLAELEEALQVCGERLQALRT